MKRSAIAIAVSVLVLLPVSGAGAFPIGDAGGEPPPGIDKVGTVRIGSPFDWDGSTATGLNNYYWDPAGVGDVGPLHHTTCTKTVETYCDQILLEFNNPLTQAEIDAGKTQKTRIATVTIDTFTPAQFPVSDFDLFSYASDPNGTLGEQLDSDGNITNTTSETNSFQVRTTIAEPSVWVLIRVVYYQVVQGSYKGHAKL